MCLKRWGFILLTIPCIRVHAERVEVNWTIGYLDYNLSGLFTRRTIGVNGKWPIPPVIVTLGDVLAINVNNQLSEVTSLHTHGIFQNGTNYYDGAMMVTECGIRPNTTFTYEIPIYQAGTFWIHSHSKSQTTDGLRTPLVVRDPNDPYVYDGEIILSLEDWFRENAATIIKQFNDPNPSVRFKPMVPYGVIGGVFGSGKTIKFEPKKTYRIRLANIGSSFEFHFSIDGHDLYVIELDGIEMKMHKTNEIILAAGQRASVLVTAKSTANHNYLFHADMFTDLIPMPKYNPLNYTGMVEYSVGANVDRRYVGGWSVVNDLDLTPLDGEMPMTPDVSVTFDAYSAVFDDNTFRHSFNNLTYGAPKTPSLITALTSGEQATNPEIYGRQANPHVFNYMDVVELVVRNHDYYSHPFHLHGHAFQVIEIGPIRPGAKKTKQARNSPVKRDTLNLRGGQYGIIRFRADNPGVWLFHCHIDFHIMLGLQMTFIEAPLQMQERIKLPESVKNQCKMQDIPLSGNAAGQEGLNMTGQQVGPNPYPDMFEPMDPPPQWQMLSYIIFNEDNLESAKENTEIETKRERDIYDW